MIHLKRLHVGSDCKTGLIHSASVTAAKIYGSHEVPNLLHGEETRFYGNSAYRGNAQRERLKALAPRAKDFTNKRAYKNAPKQAFRFLHPPSSVFNA
jgi:IS5 family transposase